MRSGDLVMLKNRWSYRSLRLGILLQKNEEDYWKVLWSEDSSFELEHCHQGVLTEIHDYNLKEAGDRWKIVSS